MKYDITKHSAPKMPTLKSVTECVQILPSQASKDTQNPSLRCFFSAFGAYMGGAEFQHPAISWRLKGQKCGEKWGDGAP